MLLSPIRIKNQDPVHFEKRFPYPTVRATPAPQSLSLFCNIWRVYGHGLKVVFCQV